MAPPVPYGHYAKDYVGAAHKQRGDASKAICSGSSPVMAWAITAWHGDGDGDGCDGPGCGSGHGAFGHNGGSGCGEPGCFGGISCGILGHRKHGGGSADGSYVAAGYATTIEWRVSTGRPDPVRTVGLRADRLQYRRQTFASWPLRRSFGFRPLRRPGLRHRLRSRPRKWKRIDDGMAAAGSAAARAASIASARAADSAR